MLKNLKKLEAAGAKVKLKQTKFKMRLYCKLTCNNFVDAIIFYSKEKYKKEFGKLVRLSIPNLIEFKKIPTTNF